MRRHSSAARGKMRLSQTGLANMDEEISRTRLRSLRWFEVMRIFGHIENGNARHYQLTLSVGFTREEPE
jgi:flavin-binding protein dodecin